MDTKAGKRAPHQGSELRRMLRGTKPLAMVPYTAKWREAAEAHGWLVVEQHFGQAMVALPGHAWRLRRLQAAYARCEGRAMSAIDHARIGLLLGYSKADIRCFVGA